MIQKLEVTYIPASELEYANVRNCSLLNFLTLSLHHSDLGKKHMKLNETRI